MQQKAITAPVFWSVAQVAEYCGVSRQSVYVWVSDGILRRGIEYYRPNGTRKIRFDPEKIREWFESRDSVKGEL